MRQSVGPDGKEGDQSALTEQVEAPGGGTNHEVSDRDSEDVIPSADLRPSQHEVEKDLKILVLSEIKGLRARGSAALLKCFAPFEVVRSKKAAVLAKVGASAKTGAGGGGAPPGGAPPGGALPAPRPN
jgi:hypothetical protein